MFLYWFNVGVSWNTYKANNFQIVNVMTVVTDTAKAIQSACVIVVLTVILNGKQWGRMKDEESNL